MNFSREQAINASFATLGLVPSLNYKYQTVADLYNSTCVYETKIVHNKVFYKFYHSVTDGSLVHSEQQSWLGGTFEDVIEIIEHYFATTYGANKDDVSVHSGGGTINDSTMQATAVYNGETYYFVIVQKTGAIQSVKKG